MDGNEGITRDIKGFLTTRRARITPEDVGLPRGGRRRVPGLRREEVAMLAGVSAEYYIQIERGSVRGVSDEILHAIATALRLNETETAHLFDLVRVATTAPRHRSAAARPRTDVPETVQALIDSMIGAAAVVQNGLLDVVATNTLGRALYSDVFERSSARVPNVARFVFLDDRAAETFPDWDTAATDVVAMLRTEATRTPHAPATTGLIGELATRSAEFRTRWAAHDVKAHRRGNKRFRNPVVGELVLRYEALEVAGTTGLTLYGFTPEPGSPSDQALRLLASWAASESDARPAQNAPTENPR